METRTLELIVELAKLAGAIKNDEDNIKRNEVNVENFQSKLDEARASKDKHEQDMKTLLAILRDETKEEA